LAKHGLSGIFLKVHLGYSHESGNPDFFFKIMNYKNWIPASSGMTKLT
jgi:hypothetical protein